MNNSYSRFHYKIIKSKFDNNFTWVWLASELNVSYDALIKTLRNLKSGKGASPKVIFKIAEVLNIKF